MRKLNYFFYDPAVSDRELENQSYRSCFIGFIIGFLYAFEQWYRKGMPLIQVMIRG